MWRDDEENNNSLQAFFNISSLPCTMIFKTY